MQNINPRPHLGEMLTLGAAAELTGYSEKTIREWISFGTLKWYRYGNGHVIHYRDLLRAQWEVNKNRKHSKAFK